MSKPSGYQTCSLRCSVPVPVELDSVGLCVSHFTLSVEQTCAEMHRQIALRGATAERQAEVGMYVGDCALLLARVSSNLCLSDELKRRILCTFLSLMNLRVNLERATSSCVPEPVRGSRSASEPRFGRRSETDPVRPSPFERRNPGADGLVGGLHGHAGDNS